MSYYLALGNKAKCDDLVVVSCVSGDAAGSSRQVAIEPNAPRKPPMDGRLPRTPAPYLAEATRLAHEG